ncbi:hypothetical protein ACSSNL_12705 [Thalassobius sp. S69A]|uniref:hypothetical protein n=1 Tax=unclassified Thalassovita TaxID=2619711 RepID=UPI000C3CD606|nr:hypothetical protein [Paracoccaceae bacterium]
MGRLFSVVLAVMPVLAQAGVICTAEEQCRGDARSMCAPSSLRIELVRQGGYTRLWIDRQGPYPAEPMAGAAQHWRVAAFGGQHQLQLHAGGRFTYLGNRNKTFTGTCEGQV